MNIKHLVSAIKKIEDGRHKTVTTEDQIYQDLKSEIANRGRRQKQDKIISTEGLGGFTTTTSIEE